MSYKMLEITLFNENYTMTHLLIRKIIHVSTVSLFTTDLLPLPEDSAWRLEVDRKVLYLIV